LIVNPLVYKAKGVIDKSTPREELKLKEKSLELGDVKLADGVIYTSKRIYHDEDIILADHDYEKVTIVSEISTIYFAQNMHNLNWRLKLNKDEAAKAQIEKMKVFINQGWVIKDISVDAWASPEGEETFNEGLSEKRSDRGQQYMVSVFKKFYRDRKSNVKIKNPKDSIQFVLNHHGEDWDGFMKALDASDITDKNIIKNVVNSQSDLLKREQEIRNMTVIYNEIEEDILPPLRRAILKVSCYEPKKSDEEIATLATTYPDSLTNEELLYAATLTKDAETKLKIYKSAVTVYPKDWRGYNNAAFTLLVLNNVDAASDFANKANTLSPNNGIILNNLGAIESKRGDYNAAKSYYESAKMRKKIDEGYNLGIILITKGKYAEALNSFGSRTCRYNVALAQVLTGNMSGAASNLECGDKTAEAYYLLAIIGAQTGNNAMIYENLKKAIKLNPNYKNIAKEDREFIKYFDNSDFQNAIQ